MVRQHLLLNGHEYEQIPGDSEGQGSLTCCWFSAVEKMFWEFPVLRGLSPPWITCTEPSFSYESPELPLRMVAIFALPIKPDFHNTKTFGKIIYTTTFSKYTICLNNSFFSSEMTVPWQQQMLSWVRVREVHRACISLPPGAPGSLLASLSFQV